MNAPDLTQLPPPEVVETLDFETILQVHRADLLARYPEAAAVIDLESEPGKGSLFTLHFRDPTPRR